MKKLFDWIVEKTPQYQYLYELYYKSLKDNARLKDKLDDLIYEKNIIIEKYQEMREKIKNYELQ